MAKYSSLKRATRVRFSVHLYNQIMFNNKYPDILAITIFFIIVGSLYKYPSIFIFYLITLTVFLYIIYTLAYHKINGANLIKKMYKDMSYINILEKKTEFKAFYIEYLKETGLNLTQFPKNKKLFSEKKIYMDTLFAAMKLTEVLESKQNFLETQESAENALLKVFYDIS